MKAARLHGIGDLRVGAEPERDSGVVPKFET